MQFDREKFEDIYSDMKWLQGRLNESQGAEGNLSKSPRKMVSLIICQHVSQHFLVSFEQS